jgi:dihydrofolate reductase
MTPPRLPLTLIVATTSHLGIGKNGQLPWRLKSELQYFARVTTRTPSSDASSVQNAVIMGRKTWESIPPKFRPLKGRVNVVLSSKAEELRGVGEEGDGNSNGKSKIIYAKSLGEAMAVLSDLAVPRIARVFAIGGYAVYEEALRRPETERVLLTRVFGDNWDCDTFFPKDLDSEEGWKRGSTQEWRAWTGEETLEERVREGDTEFEFRIYEREGRR